MKKFVNRTHIEGILYEHDLQLRTTGPNSKNPGTEYIMGNVHLATDDEMTNVIPVHFTYVTATTANGNKNTTFSVLKDIIDGHLKSVADNAETPAMLRIDSNVGLNEFYSDRNGKNELVSVRRNEGGYVSVVKNLNEEQKERGTFEVDILINRVRRIEANEERNQPERVTINGCVFDFRNSLLPIELTATNVHAMDYFEGLEASERNPVFTRVKGRQISETIVRKITEESAFGEPSVREVTSSHREFLVTWAQPEPYVWDDDSTITAVFVQEAMGKRETYLADIKLRQDEYNASRGQSSASVVPDKKGAFNF